MSPTSLQTSPSQHVKVDALRGTSRGGRPRDKKSPHQQRERGRRTGGRGHRTADTSPAGTTATDRNRPQPSAQWGRRNTTWAQGPCSGDGPLTPRSTRVSDRGSGQRDRGPWFCWVKNKPTPCLRPPTNRGGRLAPWAGHSALRSQGTALLLPRANGVRASSAAAGAAQQAGTAGSAISQVKWEEVVALGDGAFQMRC